MLSNLGIHAGWQINDRRLLEIENKRVRKFLEKDQLNDIVADLDGLVTEIDQITTGLVYLALHVLKRIAGI